MDQQTQPSVDVQALLDQLAQQQQLIDELSQMHTDGAAGASVPHDLPARPTFDWQPTGELASLMPTLAQGIFASTLADEECKTIIE